MSPHDILNPSPSSPGLSSRGLTPLSAFPAFARAFGAVQGQAAPARTAAPAADVGIFERLPITRAERFERPRPLRVVTEHPSAVEATSQRSGRRRPGANRRPPLRLTRRGQGVVVVALAVLLTLAAWSLVRVSSLAASGPVSPASYSTVVVQPGDTLWSIASKAAPDADPRVTVRRIMELNALSGVDVQAGQELALPS